VKTTGHEFLDHSGRHMWQNTKKMVY